MGKKTTRERLRKRRQRERLRSYLIWGSLGAIVMILIGALIWSSVKPAAGEAVGLMPNYNHVEEGTDPGPFNSDPPTSGPHYASDLTAGFYEESEIEGIGPYPSGYLVHNLEHGYVIFWYNCAVLDKAGCTELKGQIQEVMEEAMNTKLIAFPWNSIDVPVVMTSWGRMQRFENFDPKLALRFVGSNRNRAPEPQAP